MQRKSAEILLTSILAAVAWLGLTTLTFAQSQSQNGQIEGTILDSNSAAIPSIVTVTNLETGAIRTVPTDDNGVYRCPLLPLGTYRIAVEASNFKQLIREGVILALGQTVTINFILEAGDITEVVTVDANSFVNDAGKTHLGRVVTSTEVHSLPLVQRAPYNFALLHSFVTGRPSRGLAIPSFNVNGYLRRVNFLLDGNTNTVYDRRSRFLFVAETAINEIQLVTNGFAPEFGDTPGMIMNMVTPSGSNRLNGSTSYRFRRPSFYSRPFFFSGSDLPDNRADIFTAAIGGPIVKDRWHYYFAFESQYRDDKARAAGRLTITPGDRDALIAAGLSPDIFPASIPTLDHGVSYVFRTDLQINTNHHLSARLNQSELRTDNGIGGGINTLERSVDARFVDFAYAIQLASYTTKTFNELRFAYGRRNSGLHRNEFSGVGPTITIVRVANFGSPMDVDAAEPPLKITQLQDNVTRTSGTHIFKFGAGFSYHDYVERAARFSAYRFANLAQYLAARNGNPTSYLDYNGTFGDPETNYKAAYWNFFVQDDWKVTRRFKLNYGLRYDFYRIPKADPTSLFHLSQNFDVDKNDFSPRIGAVYALREGKRPTVIRIGAGIYYEAPLLAIFRDVIRFNGNSEFYSVTFEPGDPGAPNFPETIDGLPPGTIPPQDIYTINPDYDTMYAIHSMIQIEQAITDDLSLSAAYVHSAGRHLNVYRNINPINPMSYLSDGRPVFGNERLDSRFGWIVIAESSGVSSYDALALQLQQRLSHGLQFSANYTLSKAVNDAPDGDIEGAYLSDPTNRTLDRGYSSANQRHTFVMSLVFQPQFRMENKTLRNIFKDNQVGVIVTANSGSRFNITAAGGADLNNDDIRGADRPVGIKRNSGRTPAQFNVDLRYSRFVRFSERFRLELFGEFQNLFNTNSIVGFSNSTVATNSTTGEVIGPLPDFRALNRSVAQESRQFQLGIKFFF